MNRDQRRSNERGLSGRLVWWVDLVQRSPKTTLAISLVTSAVALVYAMATLHFSTRRTDLLRPDHPVVMDYQRLRNEFDRESDMIVVAAGPDTGAIVDVLEQVAERLRSRPDLFEKVLDRIDVSKIKRKGLFQLSVEQLQSLEKQLAPLAISSSPPFSWLAYLFGWNPTSVEAALQSADANQRIALLRSLEQFLLVAGRASTPRRSPSLKRLHLRKQPPSPIRRRKASSSRRTNGSASFASFRSGTQNPSSVLRRRWRSFAASSRKSVPQSRTWRSA